MRKNIANLLIVLGMILNGAVFIQKMCDGFAEAFPYLTIVLLLYFLKKCIWTTEQK